MLLNERCNDNNSFHIAIAMDIDKSHNKYMTNSTSSNDNNMISSSSEEIADDCLEALQAMKRRECNYRIGDYLHRNDQEGPPIRSHVNADCRYQMCRWSFTMIDYLHYHKNDVAVAMYILDRFLDVSPWVLTDRSTFQLASITCLYMSIKLNETVGVALDMMVQVSHGSFTVRQFETMERIILHATKWRINPPTPMQMGHLLARWLSCHDKRLPFETLLDLINMQVVTALLDYGMVTVAPSLVAVAALLNAVECMGVTSSTDQGHILHNVTSVLEFSARDRQLLNLAQERLYENFSGNPTPAVTSRSVVETTSPFVSASSTLAIGLGQHKPACGIANNDARPISPNVVSASPGSLGTKTPKRYNHPHSSSSLSSQSMIR
jgi:hypothetical protein